MEDEKLSLTINIYYTGKNGSARKFAEEMISLGIVDKIRQEQGNLKYDYFFPMNQDETLLLIDSWKNQESLDIHHQSEMMKKIAELREKYDLHMKVEKYIRQEDNLNDKKYVKE